MNKSHQKERFDNLGILDQVLKSLEFFVAVFKFKLITHLLIKELLGIILIPFSAWHYESEL